MSAPIWRLLAASGLVVFVCACAPLDTQKPPPSSATPSTAAPAPYEIRLPSRSFVPQPARPDWDGLLAKGDPRGVHAVVQLQRIPDLETRAALAEAGIALGQPLTGNAYLALVRPDLNRTAPVLAKVRWTEAYRADDKLSPSLKREAALTWARRTPGRIELVVTVFPDADMDDAIARIKALGATIVGEARAARILTVSLPAGREADLAQLDAVRYVEPSVPPGQNESDRARGYIGADVGAIPAGRPNGAGVVVGVLEGGHAQTTHPDFGGRVTQGDGGAVTFAQHTTMTAGMIAGSGANSVANGAAAANQWRGVAPGASVRTYNYLNFPAGGDAITDYLNDVTDAVQNDGVHLMNNSWGDAGCATLAYGAYVGRAPFLDGVVKGTLGRPVPIVFSAGNERDGFVNAAGNNDFSCVANNTAPFASYGTLNHPKGAKNLIEVGAVDSGNNLMTAYSSWGPTLDGRIKPDLVAAGHHNGAVNSNVSSITNPFGTPVGAANQQDYRVPIHDPGGFVYGWYAQTSSAAAEVAGGLALMINGWRTAFPGRADPLPSTLRAVLVNNAVDLDTTTTWFNPGPDYASGYGLVRINNSVQSLERGDAIEGSVAHGGEARYFVAVPAGAGPLRITLAWDDEAAIDGANPALVNDLDIVVTDPTGTRRHPWTLDPLNPTAAAVRTGEDHINNLEQVQVDAPAAGSWTVVVRGSRVASGRQNFSLVSPYGFSRQPVDLILALDTSGSMNSAAGPGALAKIEVLRRSVRLLLETWNLHAIAADRVGIAAFSDNVSTTPPAIPALQPFQANFAGVTAAAAGLTASGCTALGGALQTAFSSFDPASTNKRSILVVTDGMQSANPFVGEAGGHLRIQSFAAGPLPFDAFFCTTATAQGPSGAPIVPDGLDVSAHNAEIHAIGVGVNGAGFQQVVQRLASENHGISHFTTTPDSNLDVLYINDLVRALKSDTLEIIASESGSLAAGAPREIGFPVNATSRSVTVVLSWSGANQVNAIAAQMHGPGGAVLTPAQVRQQPYFTVLKFNLASGTAAVAGTWRLTLRRDATPGLGYQLSVIADESCFHYDVAAPGYLQLGEPLTMIARATEAGRPVQRMNVRARVSAPVYSLSNLLASAVPHTRAARKYLAAVKAGQFAKLPDAAAVFEAALAELSRNRAFMAQAARVETTSVEFKPTQHKWLEPALLGETQYLASSDRFSRMGTYQVAWELAGASACGPIQRQEITGIVVGIGKIDPRKTLVSVRPGPRGTAAVRIKPVDAYGNLLGPGRGGVIRIDAAAAHPTSPVIDLLDGSYLRTFAVKGKEALGVNIGVGAENWTPPLPRPRR